MSLCSQIVRELSFWRPLSSARELIAELSMGSPVRQIVERNRGEKNNDYHGRSECGWACGRRVFTVSVSCFFFFTMVSNGVDTMRFPCSALNVKVVRNSKQARTNDRRNHDPFEGSHVCSDRSSLSSSLLHFSCSCVACSVLCVCVCVSV